MKPTYVCPEFGIHDNILWGRDRNSTLHLYIRAGSPAQYGEESVDLAPDRVLYIRATEFLQRPYFPSKHRDLYIRVSSLHPLAEILSNVVE